MFTFSANNIELSKNYENERLAVNESEVNV
jgi:hypothetical protein